MLARCECVHCGGTLEFEAEQVQPGQAIACGYCGEHVTPMPRVQRQFPPPIPPEKPRRKASRLIIAEAILFAAGMILIIAGLGFLGIAQSNVHEIYAALHYCSGAIVLGLSALVGAIRYASGNQQLTNNRQKYTKRC